MSASHCGELVHNKREINGSSNLFSLLKGIIKNDWIRDVGWGPHRQSDFQIKTLEGAPVLTNPLMSLCLFKADAELPTHFPHLGTWNPLQRGRCSDCPHFTDGDTEGYPARPKSHRREASELGFWGRVAFTLEPGVSAPQVSCRLSSKAREG